MFTERTTIGLDVHARSVIAAALDTHTGELVQRRLTPDFTDITTFITHQPQPAAVVYEAGPAGFGLVRHLTDAGIRCVVAALSKLQRPAGDRVKTDKNEALHLAKLLRLDEVTPVDVPSLVQESARDLVRTREDACGDLMSARHRLSKLLLRHGIVYYGGSAWTGKHDQWLHTDALPRLPDTATRLGFDAAYDAVLTVTARRDRLDAEIEKIARDSEFTAVVDRLGCLRGIGTLTGFGLAVEIGDWTRFTGRTIGSYVGLAPTEYSSGSSRSQGGVMKTGNGHVRRLLIEVAWHHRRQYRKSKALQARFDRAPAAARARGDEGNRRLHNHEPFSN
ncbi:IS110 family transposase [Brevibacterium marinum]|uniref:IS110 family transposase n=1 Tax=Brevibacterium marinum TaxID=418643 RepID=UPI0031586994